MGFQVDSLTLELLMAEKGCFQVQSALFFTRLATGGAKTYPETQNAAREQKPRAGEQPVVERPRGVRATKIPTTTMIGRFPTRSASLPQKTSISKLAPAPKLL